MRYKVAELEGALLDVAVALASGWKAYVGERGYCFATVPDLEHGDGNGFVGFQPSSSWDDCGPIIESERISTIGPAGGLHEWQAHCHYSMEQAPERLATMYGPTPLIAACRAYVASKFGAEVELP